jgi:hypothetical protein
MAVIDVHVLNVLRHLEPVGEYSRFGWSHPGPLYSIALAPLYSLSGHRHISSSVTAALLNVLAVWLAAIAIRHWAQSGWVMVSVAGCLGAFLLSCNGLIASPWNPHAPILPFFLLVVATAGVVSGRVGVLPLVALLASFVVQTHVGSGSAALALSALALAGAVAWASRDVSARAGIARALGQAAVIGALCWSLPLLTSAGRHNLQQLFTFFLHGSPFDPNLAAAAAQHYLAAPFTPHLSLAWGDTLSLLPDARTRHVVTLQVALLATTLAVQHWRGRRFEASLALAVLVAAGAAYWSILRLPESPKDYTVFWVSILGVLVWGSTGAAALEEIAGLIPGAIARPLLKWTPSVLLVAMAILGTRQVLARAADDRRGSPPIEALAALVRSHLGAEHTPLLHIAEGRWQPVAGVALQLYRQGPAPHVDADWVSMFGEPFTPTGRETVAFDFDDAAAPRRDLSAAPGTTFVGVAGGVAVYMTQR